MKTSSLFLFIGLCLPGWAEAQSTAVEAVLPEVPRLAASKKWHHLLHYSQSSWRSPRGRGAAGKFYLLSEVPKDPEAEMSAFVKAWWNERDPAPDQSVTCRFPARAQWLRTQLSGAPSPAPCPRFEAFRSRLRGESLSLVFSSYYLNNPSSAFGHTLFRVNKKPADSGQRLELLDYGLNYAAALDTNNALIYAFKGLFGLFPGVFSSMPYYIKVREYNNAESRDLWEYHLNVGPQFVDDFLAHAWELGASEFRYWYLDENCAFHILTMLEAVDPELKLSSELKPVVIPADTVKVVWQSGLVKSWSVRPSARTEFLERVKLLSAPDRVRVAEVLARLEKRSEGTSPVLSGTDLQQISFDQRTDSLDALIDGVDFLAFKELQNPQSPASQLKSALLQVRASIEERPKTIERVWPTEEQPHLAHGSGRLDLGYRSRSKAGVFRYRFALHDPLDPYQGYPDHASIEFGVLQASLLDSGKQFRFDELHLFAIESTQPWSPWLRPWSWRTLLGWSTGAVEECSNCLGLRGEFGGGLTLAAREESVTWTLGAFVGAHSFNLKDHNAGDLGIESRLRVRWSSQVISLARGQWGQRVYQAGPRAFSRAEFATQWTSSSGWGLKAQVTKKWTQQGAQEEITLWGLVYD